MPSLTDEERQEIMLGNVGDTDCAVVALQALTGWRRRTAWTRAKAGGYMPAHGAPKGAVERALAAAGYTCTDVPLDHRESAATLAADRDSGSWLVYTVDHVMALVDGDLYNGRGYWRAPVEALVHVTR